MSKPKPILKETWPATFPGISPYHKSNIKWTFDIHLKCDKPRFITGKVWESHPIQYSIEYWAGLVIIRVQSRLMRTTREDDTHFFQAIQYVHAVEQLLINLGRYTDKWVEQLCEEMHDKWEEDKYCLLNYICGRFEKEIKKMKS